MNFRFKRFNEKSCLLMSNFSFPPKYILKNIHTCKNDEDILHFKCGSLEIRSSENTANHRITIYKD